MESPRRNALKRLLIGMSTSGLLIFGLSPVAEASLTNALTPGLNVLGALPDAPPGGNTASGFSPLVVWPEGKEIVTVFRRGTAPNQELYLRTYDLSVPGVPQIAREAKADPIIARDSPTGRSITLDTRRDRMILLHPVPTGTQLISVDLRTFKVLAVWDVAASVPGFVAYGLTYARSDDRVYLFGDWSGNASLSLHQAARVLGWRPAWPSGVVAIEASDGALAWSRTIAHCQQPMVTQVIGAGIARSQRSNYLYFACLRAGVHVGSTGVVRLAIAPRASQAESSQFPVDFFPISGRYTDGQGIRGTTVFDPVTDRVFLQSVSSSTPGAWVFDGPSSKWVGHIASESGAESLGINPANGHVYLGYGEPSTPGGFLQVTDGRATPAPQGFVSYIPFDPQAYPEIVADPGSRRVLIKTEDLRAYGLASTEKPGWVVIDDRIAISHPQKPVNYDDLTTDIEEGPATSATYAGGIGAFGSRFTLVGGYGSVVAHTSAVAQLPNPSVGVAPGDRGLFAARISSIDLRGVGIAAAAQALAPDTLTNDEVRTHRRSIEEAGAPTGDEGHELSRTLAEPVEWPWRPIACLVADDQRLKQEHAAAGGTAAIECDGGGISASASARAGLLSATPVAGVRVEVASSSVESRSWKDVARGTVTETTAAARGFTIEASGVGQIAVEEVISKVRTFAHGRPGTNRVEYERTFAGVVVQDADGTVVFTCDDQCDPRDVIDQVNQQLETRVRLSVPEADVTTTPRGAFAGVKKTLADHHNDLTTNNDSLDTVPALQAVVFNDTVDKSRLVVQLAAVEASSIYGISLLPGTDRLPVPAGPPLQPVVLPGDPTFRPGPPPPPPTGSEIGSDAVSRPPLDRLVQGAIVLLRSPRDAVLVGLMLLLLLGPLVAFRRRLALMKTLRV